MTSSLRCYFALYVLIGGFAGEAHGSSPGNPIVPRGYCLSPATIVTKAVICRNNTEFVHWGKLCLDRFEKQAAKDSAELQKFLATGAQPGMPDQAKIFEKSGFDYVATLSSFGKLIRQNEAAINDVKDYLRLLITPIDDRYLEEVKCFMENRAQLRDIQASFEKKLSELQAAEVVAKKFWESSKAREAGIAIAENPATKIIKGGKADSLPMSSAQKKNGASDITGTDQDKNKKLK